MQMPLQITFRHMSSSAALEARIRELATRLERFSEQIVHCHVIIEAVSHHKRHGELHDVHIDITLPGEQIAIRRAGPADHAHEDVYVAVRDAFLAARRKLEDYERRRRLDVKNHGEPTRGRIPASPPAREGRSGTGQSRGSRGPAAPHKS